MSNDKAQAAYGRDDSDEQRELREAKMRFNERARGAGYAEHEMFDVGDLPLPKSARSYGPAPTRPVQNPSRAYNIAVNIVTGIVVGAFVAFALGMLALVFIGAARILF